MRIIIAIIMLMFVGTINAAPPSMIPNGTTRIQQGSGGRETYYGKSGFVGRSQTNAGGGRTYFNGRGYTGRTDKTSTGNYRYTGKK
jgi:hypothetical protein